MSSKKTLAHQQIGVAKTVPHRHRGGVIRISAGIYDEVRACILKFLEKVVFVLNKLGRPIYGFGTTERDTMND
ncbi:hypothetical protein ANO11243_081230 [Dothideomycetidae sp. 11243]|nr:hypothetical protein ANO11243_081230 [fungal sp. No.11243]